MRLRKPSPSMVVAVVALVFAMTGTGLAAKGLITGKQIKDHSITSRDLAKNAVTGKNLARGSVSTSKLAKQAVRSANLASGSVLGANLAPGAVTSTALGAGAVTGAALADGSITPAKLAFGPGARRRAAKLRYVGQYFQICPNGEITSQLSCPVAQVGILATITPDPAMDAFGGALNDNTPITCHEKEPVRLANVLSVTSGAPDPDAWRLDPDSGALQTRRDQAHVVVDITAKFTQTKGQFVVLQLGHSKYSTATGWPDSAIATEGSDGIAYQPSAASGQTTEVTLSRSIATTAGDELFIHAYGCGFTSDNPTTQLNSMTVSAVGFS